MQKISADTLISILLIMLCGVLLYETFQFRRSPLSLVPSSLWPRIVISVLALLSVAYLVQSLRTPRDGGKEGDERASILRWLADNRNVLWCFGLFAAFIAVLPVLGMLLGGIAFVFAVLTVLGPNMIRSHVVNLCLAFVSVGGMWSFFTFGLNVMLPQGVVFRVF